MAFATLDDDLLLSIVRFASAADLARCRAVCRALKRQADSDALWERHCQATLQTADTLPVWVWALRKHLSESVGSTRYAQCTGTLSVALRTSLE